MTVALTRGTGSSTTTPLNPTFSPASLTFTNSTWNTAQTVTVTATKDADGVDDAVNIVHTATSDDAAYSAITAKVAATETDNNNAPISRDFRHSVKKKTAAASTKVAVRDFQYHDADGDKMKSVIIVSLPDSADGVLKLKKTSDSTETNVAAGQTVPNDEGASASMQVVMYFHPTDAFNIDWDDVTFTYKVVDDADNVSDAAYTATLFVERADAPSALSGFAASPGKNKARLTWNNPNDSSIGLYEYQYRKKEVRAYGRSGRPRRAVLSRASMCLG